MSIQPKKSRYNAFSRRAGPIASSITFLLFFFQNCGPQFQAIDQALVGVVATGPVIELISEPAPISPSTTANFSLKVSSSSGIVSATCSIEPGPESNCLGSDKKTIAKSYSSLSEGQHTFLLNVTDGSGQLATYKRTWMVDSVLPIIVILNPPPDRSGNKSMEFFFNVSDATSMVQSTRCRLDRELDASAFVACSESFSTGDLSEGTHTFTVEATDGAGNRVETRVSWVYEKNLPTVNLSGVPVGAIPTRQATISFTGHADTLALDDFQCREQGGTYVACTSPKLFIFSSDGEKTIEIRGRLGTGPFSLPAAAKIVIDTVAPNSPTITSTEISAFTNKTSGSFQFLATDNTGGSGIKSYECRLNDVLLADCQSPKVVTGFISGANKFSVVAIDGAGNRSTAKLYNFTLHQLPPVIAATGTPENPTTANTATFAFSVSSAISMASIMCKLDSLAMAACSSPKTYTDLSVGSHTFTLQATDIAGNATSYSFVWTIQTSGDDPLTLGRKLIVENSCTTCHSMTDLYYKTATQLKNIIATGSTMSRFSGLTNTQINAIAAVLQLGPPDDVDPIQSPVRPSLGDRTYMTKLMNRIFIQGADTGTNTTALASIVNNNMNMQVGAFGGPCYLAEANCPGGGTAVDVNTTADANPLGSSLRSGFTIRTCVELLQLNNIAVQSALANAGLTVTSDANRTNMASLFSVFFPGRVPTAAVLDSLNNVVSTGKSNGLSNADAWKYPIHAMCVSSIFGAF